MHTPFTRTKVRLARFRRAVQKAASGGEWALSQPRATRRNLMWFWLDGLFASGSENILLTYLVLYALTLGASRAEVGLMSSLSSLSAALLLIPGALMVERIGRRKEMVLLWGGSAGRLMILGMALLPLVLEGQALVSAVIALSVLRSAFTNLSYPAWMSFTADIVPLEGRGRFFASRNFAMITAGMVMTFLAGELITRLGNLPGHQLSLGLAFLMGAASFLCFARLSDNKKPPQRDAGPSLSMSQMLRDLMIHPSFLVLAGTAALWNFSLNIAGPFFSVYMVENLGATATIVGINSIGQNLSNLLVQPKLGALLDRWGPRRLQLISGLLIPALPIGWVFAGQAWHVIPLNLLGGALWGVFNLASFNLLLALIPEQKRASCSALYQVIVMISLAGGAAFGGWAVTNWGYAAIFVLSGAGRLAAAVLFARYIPPSEPAAQPAAPRRKTSLNHQ